jgi:hypothetical protein
MVLDVAGGAQPPHEKTRAETRAFSQMEGRP